ncbi:MAG: branched-chain amino acid ABC transporter permease [Deltaproteobacteria bacterium]|nr:branched-chain amino acid ABC transporter permease [Deltaproteobacteria bacterium]
MLYLQALVNGILMGGVYATMALGLSLIFGVLRIINLAHGNLMVIGMYLSYWLFSLFGIDPYLSLFGTVCLLFFLGFLIQRYVLNPIIDAPEEMSVLITLGLGIIIQNVLLMAFGPDYYTVDTSYKLSSIMFMGVSIDVAKILTFGASIVIAAVFLSFLQWTELGRAIRAASNNRGAATLMGINVKKIYCIAFAIGAATAGVAGSCVSTFIPTSQGAGILFTMTSFVIVIIGGVGNYVGALAGGLLIGIVEELGAVLISGSMKQVLSFGLLIVILLFRPQGLLGREGEE